MKNKYLSNNWKQINKVSSYWLFLNHNRHYLPVFWFLTGLMLVLGDTKLVVATAIALKLMQIFYQFGQFDWQTYQLKLSEIFTGVNRQLILGVGGGGLVAIFCYLSFSIWTELDNNWLALGIILQSVITTSGFGLLVWYLWKRQFFNTISVDPLFNNLILDLTAISSIKRLLTVNQLLKLWEQKKLTLEQIQQLEDYFYLMAKTENDPLILNKIKKCLAQFNNSYHQNLTVNQPLNLPSQPQKMSSIPKKYKINIDRIRV